MRIADILKSVRAALQTWADQYKGGAEIARDPVHAFSILQQKPGGVRAVILFQSEDKRGDYEEAGLCDETFFVVLTSGKSLQLNPGDDLVDGAAGGPAMYNLIEDARDIVRGLSLDDDTEVTPNYKGCRPYVLPGNILTDAYQLEFSIGNQLPAIQTT